MAIPRLVAVPSVAMPGSLVSLIGVFISPVSFVLSQRPRSDTAWLPAPWARTQCWLGSPPKEASLERAVGVARSQASTRGFADHGSRGGERLLARGAQPRPAAGRPGFAFIPCPQDWQSRPLHGPSCPAGCPGPSSQVKVRAGEPGGQGQAGDQDGQQAQPHSTVQVPPTEGMALGLSRPSSQRGRQLPQCHAGEGSSDLDQWAEKQRRRGLLDGSPGLPSQRSVSLIWSSVPHPLWPQGRLVGWPGTGN